MSVISKAIYRFNEIHIKILSTLSNELGKSYYNSYVITEEGINRAMLSKNDQTGDITISDFRAHYSSILKTNTKLNEQKFNIAHRI